MKKYKIIPFSSDYKSLLKSYLGKTFPEYSDAYLDFCLDKSSGYCPSLLVFGEEGEIVGCHLFFCTKVFLNGKEIETHWGHNTYLDKEYRAFAGLDLVMKIHLKGGFGLGLSNTQREISKKLRQVFLTGVYNYYLINSRLFMLPIQKLFRRRKPINFPDRVIIGSEVFERVTDDAKLIIPNNGFWYRGYKDLDFIRDREFIRERFLMCKVYKYYVYQCQSQERHGYLIVRLVNCHGIPALTLSDFRYDITDLSTIDLIFKCYKSIAKIANIGLQVFLCGDKNVENLLRHSLHYKREYDFISLGKIMSNISFSITSGDSDADFLK